MVPCKAKRPSLGGRERLGVMEQVAFCFAGSRGPADPNQLMYSVVHSSQRECQSQTHVLMPPAQHISCSCPLPSVPTTILTVEPETWAVPLVLSAALGGHCHCQVCRSRSLSPEKLNIFAHNHTAQLEASLRFRPELPCELAV